MEKNSIMQGVVKYLFWMVSSAVSLLMIFLVREFYLVLAEFLGIGPRVIDVIDKLALLAVGFGAVAAFVSLFYYYGDRPGRKFLFVSCLQVSLAALLFFLRSLLIAVYLKNYNLASVLMLAGLLLVTLAAFAWARRVKDWIKGQNAAGKQNIIS